MPAPHLMRGERGSVPASRSAWRDFECWSADATRKSRDAKNVLFWQLRTTVRPHEKESYLPRRSNLQRLSDMILPPSRAVAHPSPLPLIRSCQKTARFSRTARTLETESCVWNVACATLTVAAGRLAIGRRVPVRHAGDTLKLRQKRHRSSVF